MAGRADGREQAGWRDSEQLSKLGNACWIKRNIQKGLRHSSLRTQLGDQKIGSTKSRGRVVLNKLGR